MKGSLALAEMMIYNSLMQDSNESKLRSLIAKYLALGFLEAEALQMAIAEMEFEDNKSRSGPGKGSETTSRDDL